MKGNSGRSEQQGDDDQNQDQGSQADDYRTAHDVLLAQRLPRGSAVVRGNRSRLTFRAFRLEARPDRVRNFPGAIIRPRQLVPVPGLISSLDGEKRFQAVARVALSLALSAQLLPHHGLARSASAGRQT